MKRFDFRLKSVLVLRMRALNEAEQRYGRAIQARRAVESKIEAHWQALERINQQMLSEREQRFHGAMQQGFLSVIGQTNQRIRGLENELRLAMQQEMRERALYLEANRNHELLLKLRDRQKNDHFNHEMLKEQQVQDDLFNARRSMNVGVKGV